MKLLGRREGGEERQRERSIKEKGATWCWAKNFTRCGGGYQKSLSGTEPIKVSLAKGCERKMGGKGSSFGGKRRNSKKDWQKKEQRVKPTKVKGDEKNQTQYLTSPPGGAGISKEKEECGRSGMTRIGKVVSLAHLFRSTSMYTFGGYHGKGGGTRGCAVGGTAQSNTTGGASPRIVHTFTEKGHAESKRKVT